MKNVTAPKTISGALPRGRGPSRLPGGAADSGRTLRACRQGSPRFERHLHELGDTELPGVLLAGGLGCGASRSLAHEVLRKWGGLAGLAGAAWAVPAIPGLQTLEPRSSSPCGRSRAASPASASPSGALSAGPKHWLCSGN